MCLYDQNTARKKKKKTDTKQDVKREQRKCLFRKHLETPGNTQAFAIVDEFDFFLVPLEHRIGRGTKSGVGCIIRPQWHADSRT